MAEKLAELGTFVEGVRQFTGKKGEASYRVGDSSIMFESSSPLVGKSRTAMKIRGLDPIISDGRELFTYIGFQIVGRTISEQLGAMRRNNKGLLVDVQLPAPDPLKVHLSTEDPFVDLHAYNEIISGIADGSLEDVYGRTAEEQQREQANVVAFLEQSEEIYRSAQAKGQLSRRPIHDPDSVIPQHEDSMAIPVNGGMVIFQRRVDMQRMVRPMVLVKTEEVTRRYGVRLADERLGVEIGEGVTRLSRPLNAQEGKQPLKLLSLFS